MPAVAEGGDGHALELPVPAVPGLRCRFLIGGIPASPPSSARPRQPQFAAHFDQAGIDTATPQQAQHRSPGNPWRWPKVQHHTARLADATLRGIPSRRCCQPTRERADQRRRCGATPATCACAPDIPMPRHQRRRWGRTRRHCVTRCRNATVSTSIVPQDEPFACGAAVKPRDAHPSASPDAASARPIRQARPGWRPLQP